MDVEKILEKMTLEEKLCQLTQVNANFFKEDSVGDVTGPACEFGITKEQVQKLGSVLNFRAIEEAREVLDKYIETAPHGIPMLFMMDVIHGYRTIYPVPLGMAASFDEELVKRCAAMAAKEATVSGCHVNFSPMVDMVRDARWGRVMESGGEDPYLSKKLSVAQVEGYQGDMGEYSMAACVKHFAAYGGAEAGRDYNTVDMSERTLREYYLPTYKAAVDAGVKMVMTSFNALNGVPAAGNKWLVDGILRKEWGFDGVIISDYNAFREMINHGYAADDKHAAELALNATNDIEMMSPTFIHHVEELIAEGKLSEKQVDEAVLRVLKLKDELGLFENHKRTMSKEKADEILLSKEHRELAREAAEKACVLLKNDGVLPFSRDVKRVAVIGEYGNSGDILGNWRCEGKESEAVTLLDGIRRALPTATVGYEKGCSLGLDNNDEGGIKAAVKLAKRSDAVIITLGELGKDSGEGNSRANLELPAVQYKLLDAVLKVNKNVAVVIFSGRPLALSKLHDRAPAILEAWQPGTEGGSALARLLFGYSAPEGKLPMSFPRTTGQCPVYYNCYNTGRPRSDDSRRVQYQSSYIDSPNSPLYPFGYGLSYTDFEIGTPVLSSERLTRDGSVTVSATVKNVGKRAGTETVQLYVRDVVGSCVRPIKELKGYEKVTLAPGEQATVEFTLTASDLEFYNAQLERVAENGEFRVFVGADSSVADFVSFYLE